MSTHYDQLPSLEERLRASRLVIVGTVESLELLKQQRIGDVEEQQAVAHVLVDEVLRGNAETRRVDVRFILRGARAVVNRPFREGQRVVLVLVPDVGPETQPNTWIAYLGAHYPLSSDGTFSIAPGPVAKGRSARVPLRSLRQMIQSIAKAEVGELRSWEKYEAELVERRHIAPITELPEPEHGSGPFQASPNEPTGTSAPRRPVRRKK